jgi:hypothetical protein
MKVLKSAQYEDGAGIMVCAKLNTTVVRFFLFERTFGPVLMFKNLCDGSSSTSLSQVLPKFGPFDFQFYHIFFQIQEPR